MVESTAEIKFYQPTGQYGFLSNFYPSPFPDKLGRQWPTNEHFFQAAKHSQNPEYVEEIRTAAQPGDANRLGRARSDTFRADWDQVKD